MIKTFVNGWDFSPQQLLTPAETAKLFRVEPTTVTRWAKDGKLNFVLTLGGQHRYSRQQVMYLRENPGPPIPSEIQESGRAGLTADSSDVPPETQEKGVSDRRSADSGGYKTEMSAGLTPDNSTLPTNQVAELFRVTPQTVHVWRAEGIITPIGTATAPGSPHLYLRAEIEDLRAVPEGRWSFDPLLLMTPGQMAQALNKSARTIVRWADSGRLACFRLPDGTRRFSAAQAMHILLANAADFCNGQCAFCPKKCGLLADHDPLQHRCRDHFI